MPLSRTVFDIWNRFQGELFPAQGNPTLFFVPFLLTTGVGLLPARAPARDFAPDGATF